MHGNEAMKEMLCDLHAHSVYSDGTCTPEEIIALAEEMGLAAVALTDHNTVSGLPRFVQAAAGKRVQAVAGIELSTVFDGHEVHMLGLFLPESGWPVLEEKMQALLRNKEDSNRRLVAALQRAGYDVDYESLAADTLCGRINRAHIGAEMVKKGYVKSIGEAMQGPLSEKEGFYQPPERLNALEGIALIQKAGALSVLAHPFLNLTDEELRRFLPRAKEAGLTGMETYYSLFDRKTTEKARQLAAEFGLMESGGSDFHGAHKPDIALGRGRGSLQVPKQFYDALRQRAVKQ